MWFGSYKTGAIKYDGTHFYQYTEKQGLSDNNVLCMIQDANGWMWFGTSGGGISKFDGNNFSHFTEKEGLTNNYVRCSLIDKQGSMWFGTRDGGLVRFNGNLFNHFTDNEGLAKGKVLNIMQDIQDNLWFGTFSGGVTKFDGKYFTNFSEKEGLTNNYITSLLEDKHGKIWMGTRLGPNIIEPGKFLKKSEQPEVPLFKSYSYEDGFLGIGCNIGALFEDRSGTIWIGSSNRLTAIYPEAEVHDTVAPNIQLTNIQLFNENIPWIVLENKMDSSFILGNGVQIADFKFSNVSKWYYQPENLSLAYNNNFLTFSFIGISHKQNSKIKYQYQLEGLYENWSSLTVRTDVSFGNLEPGDYQFKVKAMNSEGIWSKEYHYPFTIRPPWWNTWWFYTLMSIAFVVLIFSIIKWRGHELEQQKHILGRKVEEQTFELKQKNEELLVKNEELQAINSEKDKFFSIISHDVRGPLSSFLGLTELMAEGLQSFRLNEIQEMAGAMKDSAANLFELLGNLLEWAQMQRGLIAFNPENLILNDILKESSELFHQSARNKLISLNYRSLIQVSG